MKISDKPASSEKPLVSILLPTYNRSGYLESCVESVLGQSYENWELIICDDASEDDTPEVASEIAKGDPRIHYHRNPSRQGLPKNRNICISLSKGSLVFFIEDDLKLEPDCLRILVETLVKLKDQGVKVGAIAPRLLEREKPASAMGNLFRYASNSRRRKMNSPCEIDKFTGLVYRNFGADFGSLQEIVDIHACSLFSKKAFEEVGGYSDVYRGTYVLQEDDLHLRMRRKGYKLYFQSNAVIHHELAGTGGCVDFSSSIAFSYYFLRNQVIFTVRNFGIKSLFMIPFFFFYIFVKTVEYELKSVKLTF
jgi:glycosyltransferase involved in cell wall biosynthesis